MRQKSQRPGQHEIAEALGISVSTVSRALSGSHLVRDKVRHRVEEKARELGYKLNNVAPAQRPTQLIIITNPEFFMAPIATMYQVIFDEIRRTVQAGPDAADIEMLDVTDLTVELLQSHVVNGTGIAFLGTEPDGDIAEFLLKQDVPVVLINGIDRHLRFDCVTPANFIAGENMACLLLERGYRNFLFVGHAGRPTIRRRLSGFRQQVESADDLDVPVTLEVDGRNFPDLQGDPEGFVALVRKMLRPRFALVCSNDVIASWAVEQLKRNGLSVPDDLGVTGFDDMPVARLTKPALTTYRIDWETIGATAMQILYNRMKDRNSAAKLIQIGGEPVPRQSVIGLK